MRMMAWVLVGCLIGCLAGCGSSKPKDMIVGTWEAADAKEGKGGTITYTKEGGLIMELPGAPKMEGKYKFLEDELMEVEVTPPPEMKLPARTQKLKVKVGKDEMTTIDEKGKETKFKKKS